MDIRTLTDHYSVSPQIDPEDAEAIAAAGFTDVICNRPDEEVPPSHHARALEAALTAAGVRFHTLPLTHKTFTPENIARHRGFADGADGAVLAYCASGTRSTIAWAMAHAAELGVDAVIETAAKGGYDISGARRALEEIAASAG